MPIWYERRSVGRLMGGILRAGGVSLIGVALAQLRMADTTIRLVRFLSLFH